MAVAVLWTKTGTPAPLLFQTCGTESRLWDGFTRVTPADAYSPKAGFGWQSAAGLKAGFKRYEAMEKEGDGESRQPPIWTNPITEGAILSDRPNAFLFRAPPGEYEIYVVCGTSEEDESRYFDFTVSVAGKEKRIQVEGGLKFRSLSFKAVAGKDPLAVQFTPRSRWFVCAIMAWTRADTEKIRREIIAPFEERTYRMPPEVQAKWKEDPEPDPGSMPPLADADKKRGFAVFTRHYLECVYPHSRPRPEELNPELKAFASQGEYEPLNFIVHPLDALSGARVTVTDLGPVPAQSVDVRVVRYMLARPNYNETGRFHVVPDLLERFESLDLKAGVNARFWLTVRVPDDAKPGTYTGKAVFECSKGTAEVPIRLRVLPIRLKEDPDKLYSIYYEHPYDRMNDAEDPVSKDYFRRRAGLEHADMAAHGTHNVVLNLWSEGLDQDGKLKFDFNRLADKFALWKENGFKGPVVMELGTQAIYKKYMGKRFGNHLRGVAIPPRAFYREMTAIVKAIEAERKARGWPEFLYYPVDEPGNDPAGVAFMVTVLKAVKKAGVRTYVTADPTYDQFAPLRPYVDVWCTQPFLPDRETVLADSKARHVEYWCYPNHVNGENDHTPVAGARMTYGFGFWRSGFKTLIPWIYSYDEGDPFNYLDGYYMDFFNRREPDGTPIPVAMWEAYREGYDDYRYVYTLETLIAEAKHGGKPAVRAAAEAEKELKGVWDAIRVQSKYKYDNLWSPAEFDAYRWLVARQILSLQEAMAGR